MIYEYEAGILNLINAIFPNIKLATYATDDNIFEMMRAVTKFPAFFYQRNSAEWAINKQLRIRDGIESASFVPYEQKYTGKILVENQGQAITMASKLRFGIAKHPFITVHFPGEEELDVQFRLTSVGIGEDRSQNDDKGALRWVSFDWQSQLFMSDYNGDIGDTLVEKINIWVNPKHITEAQIYNEEGVFMTIPLPTIEPINP
jgi:hypothetical protein